jgi:hypothetical protein
VRGYNGLPISQWWPNGSANRPCRSPYGWSAIGKISVTGWIDVT